MAEAQVALGDAAGLLGVILKIGLHILLGVVADDLDRVLVGAHGAVAAKAPELAADGTLVSGDHVLADRQGMERHIVGNAHGEVVLLFPGHVVVHGDHLGGCGVLAGQAVAAAQHGQVPAAVEQHGADVLVQRLAVGAGLLGAVQHRYRLAAHRQSRQEMFGAEGTVQPHL